MIYQIIKYTEYTVLLKLQYSRGIICLFFMTVANWYWYENLICYYKMEKLI